MGLRALRAAEATLMADAAKAPAARQPEDKPARIGHDKVFVGPKAVTQGPGAVVTPGKSPELVLLASIHAVATDGLEHDSAERPPSRFGTQHPLDNGEVVVDYDFKEAIDDLRGRLDRVAKAVAGSGHERLKGIHAAAATALAQPGFDPQLTEAEKLIRYKAHAAAVLEIGQKSDLPAPEHVIQTLCRQVADAEKAIAAISAKREPLRKQFLEAQAIAGAVPLWKKCLGYGLVQSWWNNRKATQLSGQLALIEGLERDAQKVLETARGVQNGPATTWKLTDAEHLAKHASAIGAEVTTVAQRAMTAAQQLF